MSLNVTVGLCYSVSANKDSDYVFLIGYPSQRQLLRGLFLLYTGKGNSMPTAKTTKATKTTKAKKIIGTVFGGSLNIRKTASTDGKILGQLTDGEQVEILEAGEEWHKIKAGFIMARWVKIDG